MVVTDRGTDLEWVETQLLIEGVYRRYGFDFRDYAPASLRRRVRSRVEAEGAISVSGLQDKVLHDPEWMERLLLALTVHVTSMFRDPSFYLAFRRKVVPLLRTYPFARIWHAGCSSGEEVYSMLILLSEEGLLDRSLVYATDLSDAVLQRARSGVVPLSAMREYTSNYQEAGGMRTFSEYYSAKFDHAIFRPSLLERIVFAQHNLVTDGVFNEFNVVLCRNVMIYFNRTLQDRVLELINESMGRLGVLALGRRESLKLTPLERCFEDLDGPERLYRKVGS